MSGLGLGFRGRRCWEQVGPVCVDEGVLDLGPVYWLLGEQSLMCFSSTLLRAYLQFVVRCFFACGLKDWVTAPNAHTKAFLTSGT